MQKYLVVLALAVATGTLYPDFTGNSYWDDSTPQNRVYALPSPNGGKNFIYRPAQMDQGEYFQLHRDVVDRINMYRSGALRWSNGSADPSMPVPPYPYHDELNVCLGAQSMGELWWNVANGNLCAGDARHTQQCAGNGTRNEFSCCAMGMGGEGPSDTASYSTYTAARNRLYQCLQRGWDEATFIPGSPLNYKMMKSTAYKRVALGLAFTTDGRMWITVRFQTGEAGYPNCDCTGKTAGQDAGCGGPLCVAPSPPTFAPTPVPPTPPTTKQPTTNAPTYAPTVCTLPPLPVSRDVCINGYVRTCDGTCWSPEELIYPSAGDGVCQTYSMYGVDVNCQKWCCDGGDCGTTCPSQPY